MGYGLDECLVDRDRAETELDAARELIWHIKRSGGADRYQGETKRLVDMFDWMHRNKDDPEVQRWIADTDAGGVPDEWEWSPLAYAWTEMERPPE